MLKRYDVNEWTPKIVGLGGTLRAESRSRSALAAALAAAREAGAETELLALEELDLPFFRPGIPLAAYPPPVHRLLTAARQSDAMIWSTAGYHGTLAGATKNALDFLEFLANEGYLDGRPVGLIAASGGEMAGVNAIDAMVHVVHALRGMPVSLKVPIARARQKINADGALLDDKTRRRLAMLGELVVEEAGLRPRERSLARRIG